MQDLLALWMKGKGICANEENEKRSQAERGDDQRVEDDDKMVVVFECESSERDEWLHNGMLCP